MDDTLDQNGLENLLGGSEGAGTTSPPSDAGSGEAKPESPAWTSQLPKEIRENADVFSKLSGFKTIGELALAYHNKGSEAQIDLSDVAGVLQQLGAPKEGESYDFEKNLKDELSQFGNIARGAMLTKEQADKMLAGYQGIIEARTSAFLNAARAAAPKIASAVIAEFGADGAEWYKKAAANGGLNTLIAKSGLGANAQIARALVMLGREMTEESTPSGVDNRGEPQPGSWKDGARFDRK